MKSREDNIVFVVYSLRGGGAERVITRLSNEISKENKVHIVLLSRQDVFYFIRPEVTLHKPTFKKPIGRMKLIYYFKIIRYIRNTIKAIHPKSTISFGESINAFVLFSLLGVYTKKYVSNRASPLSNVSGFRGIVNPWFYPLADKVIVQTQKAIEIMKTKYKSCRFTVLHNPIDIPETISPLQNRGKNIINIGYLGGRKNQAELIRIFSELPNNKEWKLQIVGDGPERNTLKELASSLGLDNSVVFLGARKDIPELLDNARIFAFTSLSEGFPNALAEAMAAGCACISYDIITGPSELLGDGEYGELVDPVKNTREDYIQKMNALMVDYNRLMMFSNKSRKGVTRFNKKTVANEFLNIIS